MSDQVGNQNVGFLMTRLNDKFLNIFRRGSFIHECSCMIEFIIQVEEVDKMRGFAEHRVW